MTQERNISQDGFKATGPAQARQELEREISRLPVDMLDPRRRLEKMVRADIEGKPFSELTKVTYDHDGAQLCGHVMLDNLEEKGFVIGDFTAVGALTTAAIPLVCAIMHAAASRGEDLDGFLMDFVYPSIKGPSIKGKKVILVDAWLSEKSFVQTSSLVTLRHGNELNLDFSILQNEGAELLAITSLIGSLGKGLAAGGSTDTATDVGSGTDMGLDLNIDEGQDQEMTITLVNPLSQEKQDLPFLPLFRG